MRGCGKSDPPPQPFTIDAEIMMRDVLKVMDELELARVHWVGEASGGILGLIIAHRLPERIASLTMLNSPTRVHAVTPGHALDQASSEAAILKYGVAEWCRRTLAQRVDLTVASPELQEFVISEMGKTPTYVAAEIQRYIETLDTSPLLKDLKIPVFLLSGVRKQSTVEEQRKMEAQIPDVRVKLLEGYGTAINLLAPEECAREAVSFWSSLE
jgi:3-oxoadipate enol-lactonase